MTCCMKRLPLLPALLIVACAPAPGRDELVVFAAASLRNALEDLSHSAARELGVTLVFNFAGSGELARQLRAGAKADVFFSADEEWMDRLSGAGKIDPGSRVSLLSNRLTVVVPADAPARDFRAEDLADPALARIALADPESVPAGRYAREWLRSRGLWQALAGRIVPTLDVRAALAAVEAGAVDAGIVYRTDARGASRVRVVLEVPEQEGPRISYPVAVIAGTPRRAQAKRLVAWLVRAEAQGRFEGFGFAAAGRGERR